MSSTISSMQSAWCISRSSDELEPEKKHFDRPCTCQIPCLVFQPISVTCIQICINICRPWDDQIWSHIQLLHRYGRKQRRVWLLTPISLPNNHKRGNPGSIVLVQVYQNQISWVLCIFQFSITMSSAKLILHYYYYYSLSQKKYLYK